MLSMFRRVVLTGIGAGLFAGLLVTFVQAFTTIPLIVAAEVYETGDVHDHGPEARLDGSLLVLAHSTVGEPAALPGEPEPVSIERRLSTLVANLVTGAGFGLLLAGAMTLAGHGFTPQRGLLWGIAGFATFTLAPSLGLAPEVPGAVTADLAARQAWWLMTAGLTAAGLALILLSGRSLLALLGIVALALPHVIGSPAAGIHGGAVPPELAAEFVSASLVSQAIFWAVLGYAVGWIGQRIDAPAPDRLPQPA